MAKSKKSTKKKPAHRGHHITIWVLVAVIVIAAVVLFAMRGSNHAFSTEDLNSNSENSSLNQESNQSSESDMTLNVEINFKVLEISNEEGYEYAKILVNNILSSPGGANPEDLGFGVGEEITIFLLFGSSPTTSNFESDIYGSSLPGLEEGSQFRGVLWGCDKVCNDGRGWGLLLYKDLEDK